MEELEHRTDHDALEQEEQFKGSESFINSGLMLNLVHSVESWVGVVGRKHENSGWSKTRNEAVEGRAIELSAMGQ